MTEYEGEETIAALIPIIAGGTSGVVTRFVCQPLDVIKIRFQLQVEPISKRSSESKYQSLLQACRLIFKEEGVRAFWKGHVPAQVLSLTYGVVQFSMLEFLVKQSKVHPTLAENKAKVEFASGFIAGCSATLVSFPFDVLRTRMIAQGKSKAVYASMFQALGLIGRCEGVRGYFRGLTPTLIQIGPLTGLNFAIFSHLKRTFHDYSWLARESNGLTVSGNLLTGCLSGFISKLIIYPLDLSRKRMQIQGFQNSRVGFGKNFICSSLLNCLFQTVKVERPSGLYKGLVPSLLKASIVSGMTFTIYETTNNFLHTINKVRS